jgi:formamidopyrimidine-DNA glycosylase
MPELPDIKVYVHALRDRIDGGTLEGMRIANAFVVRSVVPTPADVAGLKVIGVGHQAKRIVITLEREFRILIHLMIAGRLHWRDRGTPLKGRNQLAALDFDTGTLVLIEAGTKRRARYTWSRARKAARSWTAAGSIRWRYRKQSSGNGSAARITRSSGH